MTAGEQPDHSACSPVRQRAAGRQPGCDAGAAVSPRPAGEAGGETPARPPAASRLPTPPPYEQPCSWQHDQGCACRRARPATADPVPSLRALPPAPAAAVQGAGGGRWRAGLRAAQGPGPQRLWQHRRDRHGHHRRVQPQPPVPVQVRRAAPRSLQSAAPAAGRRRWLAALAAACAAPAMLLPAP